MTRTNYRLQDSFPYTVSSPAIDEPKNMIEQRNNPAERSIKPFVMGRKNRLFANTPAGAQSSAVIYGLIETAKENLEKEEK